MLYRGNLSLVSPSRPTDVLTSDDCERRRREKRAQLKPSSQHRKLLTHFSSCKWLRMATAVCVDVEQQITSSMAMLALFSRCCIITLCPTLSSPHSQEQKPDEGNYWAVSKRKSILEISIKLSSWRSYLLRRLQWKFSKYFHRPCSGCLIKINLNFGE